MGKLTDVKILTVEEFNKLKLVSTNTQDNNSTLIPIYWKYVYKELLNKVEADLLSKDAERCLIKPSIVSDKYKDAAKNPVNNLYATLECYIVYISYDSSKPDWIEGETSTKNVIYVSKKDLNNLFNNDNVIGKSIEAKYSKNIKKLDLQITIEREYAYTTDYILGSIYLPIIEDGNAIIYSLISSEPYKEDIELDSYREFIKNKVYSYAYPSFPIGNAKYTIRDLKDSYCEKHDENNPYISFTLLTSCCKLFYKIWTTSTSYIIKVKSTEIPDNGIPCYLIWPNMELVDIPSIFSKYHIGVMDNSEYYENF